MAFVVSFYNILKSVLKKTTQLGNKDYVHDEAEWESDLQEDADNKYMKTVTPLLRAAEEGSLRDLDHLLRRGADPNVGDFYGETALHRTVRKDSLEMVDRLLQGGADPNAYFRIDGTPLHIATPRDSSEIVERLLQAGADPNIPDEYGGTPLHFATSGSSFKMVDLLLQAGADPNARDNDGNTPLHDLSSLKRDGGWPDTIATLGRLSQAGADPNARDKDGNTPLHLLASGRTPNPAPITEVFLQAGANPNLKDSKGQTPFDIASLPLSVKQRKNAAVVQETLRQHQHKERNSIETKAPQEPVREQTERKDIKVDVFHKEFAEAITKQIKAGVASWQKPWKPGEKSMPENFSTGKEYRGGNTLYLMSKSISEGYGDNRWGTYKQIKAAGGQVRKGEKGSRILFFEFKERELMKDEKEQSIKDKDGKQVYKESERAQPIVRLYTVFNVEQADGLKLPPRAQAQPEWKSHENAELVMRSSGVRINHVAGDQAVYNLGSDSVTLPERGQFTSATSYYQTALHEVGHASGHPSRLNRISLQEGIEAGYGSEAYAREELRAEISAMMTGNKVGVGHDGSRGAAYVEGWLKALEKDPREIYHAAAEAQKISDYLVEPLREQSAEIDKKHDQLTQKFSRESGPQISHSPSPQEKVKAQEMERATGPSR